MFTIILWLCIYYIYYVYWISPVPHSHSLNIFFFLIPNSSRQFRDSFEIRKFYTNYSITHNTQLFHVNQTTSLRIRTRKMIQVFIKFESTQFWWFMFGSLAAPYLDDTQYTRFLDSRWEYIKQTHKTRVMVFTSNSHKMSHKVLLLEFGFDFTVFPWNSKPSIAAGLNPELQCPCPHTFNIRSFYFCLFRIPLLPHQHRRLIPLSPKYCERHESCSLCFDCPDPGVFLL